MIEIADWCAGLPADEVCPDVSLRIDQLSQRMMIIFYRDRTRRSTCCKKKPCLLFQDECNTKYGDVIRVIIHELPNAIPEEAVRIFVEFKRIESAIKAVVDLNGRFFGGRQVMAGFYPWEKLENLQLLD